MNNMLPIGTVIKVRENNNRYIIVGRLRLDKNAEYEYICTLYPYGYLEIKDFFYFKLSEVDTIVFLGDINY